MQTSTFESGGVSIRSPAKSVVSFQSVECLPVSTTRGQKVDAALGFPRLLREWLDGRCLRRSRWSVLDNTRFSIGGAATLAFSYHRATASYQAEWSTSVAYSGSVQGLSLPRRCTSENLDAALPPMAPRRIGSSAASMRLPPPARCRSRRLRSTVPVDADRACAGLWGDFDRVGVVRSPRLELLVSAYEGRCDGWWRSPHTIYMSRTSCTTVSSPSTRCCTTCFKRGSPAGVSGVRSVAGSSTAATTVAAVSVPTRWS